MDLADHRDAEIRELFGETTLEPFDRDAQHALLSFRSISLDEFQQSDGRFVAEPLAKSGRHAVDTHLAPNLF